MTQAKTLKIQSFCHWNIGVLVIVSYFVLRISNFLTEKTGFSVKHYLRSLNDLHKLVANKERGFPLTLSHVIFQTRHNIKPQLSCNFKCLLIRVSPKALAVQFTIDFSIWLGAEYLMGAPGKTQKMKSSLHLLRFVFWTSLCLVFSGCLKELYTYRSIKAETRITPPLLDLGSRKSPEVIKKNCFQSLCHSMTQII